MISTNIDLWWQTNNLCAFNQTGLSLSNVVSVAVYSQWNEEQ